VEDFALDFAIGDTKENLQIAARNEMDKIERSYPDFVRELEKESYDDAIANCMYSWKSHQQHEKQITKIVKYSGLFFGSVISEIEGMKLHFHVCRVCGSTLEKEPQAPCAICNRSMSNYQRIARPGKA
jgi:rubrerythrin